LDALTFSVIWSDKDKLKSKHVTSVSKIKMAYLILWLTLTSYVMCRSERECTNDTCSDGLGLRTSTGVGIDVKPIWKARVDTFDSCAEACVKKTRCKAVTFHADTRVCELHEVLLSPSNNRTGQYLVYSEFSWWPSTVSD